MQKKEAERLAEEAAKNTLAREKGVVVKKLDVAQEDLAETNRKLVIERDNATDSAKQAQAAQVRAEASARAAERAQAEAVASKDVAVRAKDETKKLYDKEHDRAERLTQQLGSTAIDMLKK